MDKMRDDERYMIPAESNHSTGSSLQAVAQAATTLPEVAPAQHLDPAFTQDKYSVPDQSLEAVPSTTAPSASASPLTGYWSSPKAEKPLPTLHGDNGRGLSSKQRTICGLRRRTIWMVLALAAIIVISGVVGGVVGSLKARSSSTPTSTGNPTKPTGPLAANQRALAASSSSGNSDSTFQVFYQDLDTTTILYRLVWANQAKKEQDVSLTVAPNQGTPLALTAHNFSDSGDVVLNLFYLSTNDSSSTTLARATLQCPNGADSCTMSYNDIISSNLTKTISTSSRLSALLMNGTTDQFRVYLQGSVGFLWVLATESETSGWEQRGISDQAQIGSSIGTANRGVRDNLLVVYTFLDNGLPKAVDYNDTVGVRGGANVASSAGPGWTTTSRFSVCYENLSDQYHVYYVAPSTGEMWAYFRNGINSAWQQSSNETWGKSDGDVTSIGWLDQVRLLYFDHGRLSMNAKSPKGWTARTYL